MSPLVDTHAHLHDTAFDGDRAAVLARARAAGVAAFLTIGTDVPTSEAAVALAQAEPDVYAAVGIHPHDAATADAPALARIAALARAPKVVAIGELGLDYYRDLSPRVVQRTALVAQLGLARTVGKPVLLHCREAHADLLELCATEDVAAGGGILHCFSGDLAVAHRGLDLGLLISIAGPVTYPSARTTSASRRALGYVTGPAIEMRRPRSRPRCATARSPEKQWRIPPPAATSSVTQSSSRSACASRQWRSTGFPTVRARRSCATSAVRWTSRGERSR